MRQGPSLGNGHIRWLIHVLALLGTPKPLPVFGYSAIYMQEVHVRSTEYGFQGLCQGELKIIHLFLQLLRIVGDAAK